MSTKNKLLRRQIRAAVQIHSHLAGAGRFGPIPVLYDHEWQELNKTARRFEIVREKGWHAAANSLLSQIDLSAASLGRRLDRFRHELPRAPARMQVLGPRDIAADLAALEQEFVEVELNLLEKKLSVVTSPIELEDTLPRSCASRTGPLMASIASKMGFIVLKGKSFRQTKLWHEDP